MYEALIENVPLLSALSDYERMNVADALIPKSFAMGETIVRQGDPADGMYFMEDGLVAVFVDGAGNRKKVSIFGTYDKQSRNLLTFLFRSATSKREATSENWLW